MDCFDRALLRYSTYLVRKKPDHTPPVDTDQLDTPVEIDLVFLLERDAA